MSVIDLRRRLDRIEASRFTGTPNRVMADAPITDNEADAALANWRARIARGEATLSNGVLVLIEPEMTADEWAARHVTEH